MVGREITPTEIGKHSKLIKAAQEEMATMDVLVCGRCLVVFHFIEDFKQHKLKPCNKDSINVRECSEPKPKIWAFLLWKATQLNNNKDTNTISPNSWALYQTWVKMDESMRETWIVAGNTIQSFAKISQGNLQETPVKITKTVVNNNEITLGRKPLTQTKPQVANLKPPVKLPMLNKTQDAENDTALTPKAIPLQPKVIKKPIIAAGGITQAKIGISPTQQNKPLSRRAKRTIPNSEETTEDNVEKIMAKRFNPRRKMHEYLVKWEGCTNEQNTWEIATNLENVPHMLDTFEKQLARQKETRAALQAKQAAMSAGAGGVTKTVDVQKASLEVGRKEGTKVITTSGKVLNISGGDADAKGSLASPTGGEGSARPTRSSKTRAMDQVKQWVSGSGGAVSAADSPASTTSDAAGHDGDKDWSMSATNASLGGIKRKLDDSDYNDSNASDLNTSNTNIEDLEEDLIPSHTVKRLKNGSSISVEIKSKPVEPKVIKVNGTASRSGSETPTTKSAEVIITQDSNASGVVKKPGFNANQSNSKKTEAQIRVLSKGEAAVSNSGIVRIGATTTTAATTAAAAATSATVDSDAPKTNRVQQQIRIAGRQTPTTPSTQITVSQRQHTLQRTPGGTTIQRKPLPVGGAQQQQQLQRSTTTLSSTRTAGGGALQQAASAAASGRMIIPRTGVARPAPATTVTKTVTPEQKILQLSKSGDLKVTKKVMTREDAVAQRMTPLQRQQQLRQQHQQQQQQSQVQIQKVQQITPPVSRPGHGNAVTVRKTTTIAAAAAPPAEEEEHQAQLCPITGKLIGRDGEPLPSPQPPSTPVLQTQLSNEQQIGLQQEQHEIDPTLLLTGDQQMLANEDGTPVLVTGEDGTVYQVAGKNAEGQTILVTQGPDGEQQFAYVADTESDENQHVLTLDNAVAEAVAQLPAEQQAEALAAAAAGEGQYLVNTTQEDGTTQVVAMTEAELAQHQALAQQTSAGETAAGSTAAATTGQLCIQTGSEGADVQEANIPAEVVQADMPSPGGTRRVVLLLQDGTYMMTEMHDDEFKALNIAA